MKPGRRRASILKVESVIKFGKASNPRLLSLLFGMSHKLAQISKSVRRQVASDSL